MNVPSAVCVHAFLGLGGSSLDHRSLPPELESHSGMGKYGGCFMFDIASLPLEVARSIEPTMGTKVAVQHQWSSSQQDANRSVNNWSLWYLTDVISWCFNLIGQLSSLTWNRQPTTQLWVPSVQMSNENYMSTIWLGVPGVRWSELTHDLLSFWQWGEGILGDAWMASILACTRRPEALRYLKEPTPEGFEPLAECFISSCVSGSYRRIDRLIGSDDMLSSWKMGRTVPLLPPVLWNVHNVTLSRESWTNHSWGVVISASGEPFTIFEKITMMLKSPSFWIPVDKHFGSAYLTQLHNSSWNYTTYAQASMMVTNPLKRHWEDSRTVFDGNELFFQTIKIGIMCILMIV